MSNTHNPTTDHDAETATTDAGLDPEDLFRTNPVAGFKGHLFNGAAIRAAGVENGGKADHPVPPLCGKQTRRGPFESITVDRIREYAEREVDDDERDLCGLCVGLVIERLEAADTETDAPFNPATFTVAEIRTRLDQQDRDLDEVRAVRQAEAEGKDRTTALEYLDRVIRDRTEEADDE